jgi:hypothetical protein
MEVYDGCKRVLKVDSSGKRKVISAAWNLRLIN